jgi:methyl-accepting chemotaxis protein
LHNNLYIVFGGTAVAMIAVLYLFGGMLLSVLRSLISIEAGAHRLEEGEVSQAVDSYPSDELREVGGAVNKVAQTLQKFTNAQLDMVRAHNEDGRVSEEMRASEFPGAYGEMARNLNAMVKGHIDVQTRFTDLMAEYAGGEFDSVMPPLPGEHKAISDAAEQVRAGLEANAKAAEFNSLIKAALDCVDSAVGVADAEANIIYLNPAFIETLRKNEAQIRQKLPGFDAEKAVGASAGALFDDPADTVARTCSQTKPHLSRTVLGGRIFEVVDSPIFDGKGERRGVTGRWSDLTDQLAAEKEVAELVDAAAAGDFTQRIEEGGKSGFMLQMAKGLNQVLGTSEQALGELFPHTDCSGRWRPQPAHRRELQGLRRPERQLEQHGSAPARHHRPGSRGERIHQHSGARNRHRQ